MIKHHDIGHKRSLLFHAAGLQRISNPLKLNPEPHRNPDSLDVLTVTVARQQDICLQASRDIPILPSAYRHPSDPIPGVTVSNRRATPIASPHLEGKLGSKRQASRTSCLTYIRWGHWYPARYDSLHRTPRPWLM